MNKLVLSILGLAAMATLSSPAQARDYCYRPSYGYRTSTVRVYYPSQPVYYGYPTTSYHRSYSDCRNDYDTSRCDDRREEHHHRHHGVRGFFEHLFR